MNANKTDAAGELQQQLDPRTIGNLLAIEWLEASHWGVQCRLPGSAGLAPSNGEPGSANT
ncbi:hypothetical protein [Stutzerimonas kunmingensis]|uniref:hypothetical protein n=1 Tax=Stutzerimonas kunmingensis TaxID=1211807 RepID=UPI0028ACF2CE|nr:hypothetical protein [Stutzerimonas kunmingensis]